MKVALTSLLVDDQEKALKFYTEVLGFVKHTDFPIGEFRWLTVVSSEGTQDVQVVLEPNAHPQAKIYQKALFNDGIPATAFQSSDIHKEYEKLTQRGVVFRGKPTQQGPVTLAVFEDTCGNLIQLFQT